ncbi:MAG TPA: amidophosphoribosyltransferase [Candidatus Borkfalkia excrementavium]|uniref:Amidophosphoribosyltransferase n=1 Tax=Candidatus Borkfalkia excrementavium TaxID=2838505 RepID=A0A9D1Z764_9FIRM|nr:amidophosphoribosyltransferase [Candidatus Borkfalkia excrementavium]
MYLRDGKLPFDSMNEECGVFGVYSTETRDVAHTVYYGLYALQHRGQESGGIAVAYANKIQYYKGMGLIPEVFANGHLDTLPEGDIAIGHVRYSTTGASLLVNAQPIVFTGKCGKMALAHNGNLTNTKQLREELIRDNAVFQTSIDSEVMALLINKYSDGDIVKGVIAACNQFKGSFALVVMTADKLIAVRDPYGIRPLVLGKSLDDTIIASETCAIDAVSGNYVRDVQPGEVVVIDGEGEHSYFLNRENKTASCIFEYVYFARPDSVIDGCSVYEARKEAGRILAKYYPVDADIVSGVPDSGVVAARGYSEVSGIPYVEALAKNRYVGRTFIQPEQGMRENSVSVKMNALRANIRGKRLIIIDDSIVRGTTSRKTVKMLRDAGAKEVHMMVCSPIVKHPCHLGIDMQSYSQLVGANRTQEEIGKYIGVDSITYLTVDQLIETCKNAKLNFCTGCFDGRYPYPMNDYQADKHKFE